MDPQPLIIDVSTQLPEIAHLVTNADPRHLVSGFIIVAHDRYLGIGSVQHLVSEVTTMQMDAARYANPLTQLPGSIPINRHIDGLLADGESFCVCYCDLDHFKPFNDVYGYTQGDAVIQLAASLLRDACDDELDFVGHIGGDDFVTVFRSVDWMERCQRVLDRFASAVLAFFSNDDIERDGYVSESRKGKMEFHKLTSLSIGVVEVTPGMFSNHLEVATIAAEVKRRAKAVPGNSLWTNHRQYVAGERKEAAPSPGGT
jgi:diguanylate cyclase (GGDEF)-like protein